MNVLLYSRFGQYPVEIESLVKSVGLNIVKQNPDVVITYGGDGTLLGAERDFPTVPKLPLKKSQICHVCSTLPNEKLVELLSQNRLKIQKYFKLETRINEIVFLSLNEIALRNTNINSALRFKISINNSPFPLEQAQGFLSFIRSSKEPNNEDFIGDGLVVSTPFGSTAYFRSITKDSFSQGIGLAFNNIYNSNLRQKILEENSEIKIDITRGPGQMSSDNDPQIVNLVEGDKLTIKMNPNPAQILIP